MSSNKVPKKVAVSKKVAVTMNLPPPTPEEVNESDDDSVLEAEKPLKVKPVKPVKEKKPMRAKPVSRKCGLRERPM